MSEPDNPLDFDEEGDIIDLIQGLYIPPQPAIVEDIRRVSPQLDLIAERISADPGLSGMVFKTVNSAYFGLPKPITSISQGVVMLGLDQVITLINALLLKAELGGDHIEELDTFWNTAKDVAGLSAIIARELNLGCSDEAYTIGLFHNCGIPILARHFDDYLQTIPQTYVEDEKTITELEFNIYKTNHAAVGYRVARVWNLPEAVCLAIRDHHAVKVMLSNKKFSNPKVNSLISVLKIAEHLSRVYQRIGHQDEDFEWIKVKDFVLGFLGLSEYDYDDMKESLEYQLGGLP